MAESLVETGPQASGERRRYYRYVMPFHVTAVRRKGVPEPGQGRVVSLYVKDISKGGICGVLSEELACDEELMLFIPPQGGRGERDVRGRVMRCEKIESQYRIGVAFNDPLSESGSHIH